MIELTVAIVTAIAGLVTARGLPTLNRRLKDHVALLKELPDDLPKDVKSLLAKEIAEMAARDRRRLLRPLWDTAARITSFVVIFTFLLVVIVFLGDPAPTDPDAPPFVQITGWIVVIALAIGVSVILGLVIWLAVDPLGKRRS